MKRSLGALIFVVALVGGMQRQAHASVVWPSDSQQGLVSAPRDAVMLVPSSELLEGEPTLAPFAHVRFCMQNPAECEAGPTTDRAQIDNARYSDLLEVNARINAAVRPMSKHSLAALGGSWEVNPMDGDCNDYAISKRHELIKRGWSPSNLLLSVVRTPSGEGHLVLVVRTSSGDYVLDNLREAIWPWTATHYHWLALQSTSNPKLWVSLRPQVQLRTWMAQAPKARPNRTAVALGLRGYI